MAWLTSPVIKVFRGMLAALPTCLRGVESCRFDWYPLGCLKAFATCTLTAAWIHSRCNLCSAYAELQHF